MGTGYDFWIESSAKSNFKKCTKFLAALSLWGIVHLLFLVCNVGDIFFKAVNI